MIDRLPNNCDTGLIATNLLQGAGYLEIYTNLELRYAFFLTDLSSSGHGTESFIRDLWGNLLTSIMVNLLEDEKVTSYIKLLKKCCGEILDIILEKFNTESTLINNVDPLSSYEILTILFATTFNVSLESATLTTSTLNDSDQIKNLIINKSTASIMKSLLKYSYIVDAE